MIFPFKSYFCNNSRKAPHDEIRLTASLVHKKEGNKQRLETVGFRNVIYMTEKTAFLKLYSIKGLKKKTAKALISKIGLHCNQN